MTPGVAVVIAVWDSYVRWLGEAVRSVADQDVGAEVIIVDNASSTPVPGIAGTKSVRSPTRLSTGAARNLGLEQVTAPLVVFLDADDVMLPGSLAALMTGLRADPGAVAFVLGIVEADTGRRHRSPRALARRLARVPRVFAVATSVWSLVPTQGATIMRAQTVRDAGGYADRTNGEDWVLAAALAWRGRVRFGTQPALVYRWRQDSPGRASSRRDLTQAAGAVRARIAERSGATRIQLGLVAASQWLAIAVLRPVFRPARRLLGAWRL